MGQELLWIVDVWGKKRGLMVDVAAEREEEERAAQEKSDLEHIVQKIMRRKGWS